MKRGRRPAVAGRPDAVTLRAGRERSVARGHPWVFSGAVAHVGNEVQDGDVAEIRAADGTLLGRGFVNRRSQIVARMLTFGDDAFATTGIEQRLAHAVAARGPGARRVAYAESDGLPGLIVDRYGDFAVMQLSTLGMERLRDVIIESIVSVMSPRGVYERSEGEPRRKEGLAPRTGLAFGEEPPEVIEIDEEGPRGSLVLLVDVRKGHKTGAYLDQRVNRARVARHAPGSSVLNAFSYTGGFGLHAHAAGARRVLNIDTSAEALALATKNAARLGTGTGFECREGDAFGVLRELRAAGETFDLVIVDPPKFVDGATHLDAGLRGYRDVNRVAMQLVRPGGHLATFSCSGLVTRELFQRVVWSASREAGRVALIVERLGQPDDHPVRLDFPESEYLEGMLLRVD